jgi:hypothetical protein
LTDTDTDAVLDELLAPVANAQGPKTTPPAAATEPMRKERRSRCVVIAGTSILGELRSGRVDRGANAHVGAAAAEIP